MSGKHFGLLSMTVVIGLVYVGLGRAAGDYIVKFWVEEAVPGSTYETGPLHIVYNSGAQSVEKLAPKKASTGQEVAFNQEGISDPQLAEDRQTLGWLETYDNCCTSYSVPLAVVVYRSGKIIRRIQEGQMVYTWAFVDQGKQVAVLWGPTHGPGQVFHLYDVATGRKLAEVSPDFDSQQLKPNAPAWARKLELKR